MASFKFHDDALRRLTSQVMQSAATRGRQRLQYVTCPVHHSQHQVRWQMHGDTIRAGVNDACCEALNEALVSATNSAVQ